MLLAPLSKVYSSLARLKNWSYDSGTLKVHKFLVPVVSVGNITVGGTGKTPFVSHLLSWCQQQGIKAGVVSRGYKGEFSGIQRVDPSSEVYFGDEPTWMAENFPQAPIYVGADRVAVVEKLMAENKVDIIFADDAFQHRRMGRNLDIVVVDATEPVKSYRVLPSGRAREPITGLNRAKYIVLNKANLIDTDERQKLNHLLKGSCPGFGERLLEGEYHAGEVTRLLNDAPAPEKLWQSPILVVSAIGRPQAFSRMLRQDRGANIVGEVHFKDHHKYTKDDVDLVLGRAHELGARRILTTAKDAVKLKPLLSVGDEFFVCHLKVEFSSEIEKLHRSLLELVGS